MNPAHVSPELPPLNAAAILRRYGLHPDKRLGQNFLVENSALQSVVQAAEIKPDEAILEIGPGLGSLTRHLCLLARKVVAVELDGNLLAPLQEILAPFSNIRLIQGDILSLDPADLMADTRTTSEYLVVANIPYYITSALLRHLLEASLPPQRMVMTVQKEVAQRICASPGQMSLLSLSVQVYGQPKIVTHIPAGAFYPAPKVDSAIVRVDLAASPHIPEAQLDNFFRLAKAGFSQKRKTLRNALAGGMQCETWQSENLLQAAGIDSRRRAETLSLQDWRTLTEIYLQNPNLPPDHKQHSP